MNTSPSTLSPRFDRWRSQARALLSTETKPEHATWASDAASGLDLRLKRTLPKVKPSALKVTRKFLDFARHVSCHTAPDAPALLYSALWRLTHGEPQLFEMHHIPLVRRLNDYHKAIHREIHKAHAFIRFKRIENEQGEERYVSWFEPQYPVVELAVGLFMKRFPNMEWSVLSPWSCAHWENRLLSFSSGLKRPESIPSDDMETLWRTYYRGIFNPARPKTAAMKREMPVRCWKNLPEAADIQVLTAQAMPRMQGMIAAGGGGGRRRR